MLRSSLASSRFPMMSDQPDCEIVDGVHGHRLDVEVGAPLDEALRAVKHAGEWFSDTFPSTALVRLQPARRLSLQGRQRRLEPVLER